MSASTLLNILAHLRWPLTALLILVAFGVSLFAFVSPAAPSPTSVSGVNSYTQPSPSQRVAAPTLTIPIRPEPSARVTSPTSNEPTVTVGGANRPDTPTAVPNTPTPVPTPTPAALTVAPLPLQEEAKRDAPTGGTFRWRVDDEPQTLDPALADDFNSTTLTTNLFDGLVQLDRSMVVRPALARSWSVSSDGKTYTFTLRPDLKFSNADPITATNVLYSWNRVAANPKAPNRSMFNLIVGYDDVVAGRSPTLRGLSAPDPRTVRVELVKPAAYWLTQATLPAFAVVDKTAIERYPTTWTEGGLLVGSGAFILAEWRHDQSLRLIANPFYWEGRAGVDTVEVAVIKDDATARARYLADALDEIGVPPAQAAATEADLTLNSQYRRTQSLRVTWLGFKTDGSPFGGNALLRRAICQAIDRNALVAKALTGYAVPASSLYPTIALTPPDAGESATNFDPDKARQELRDAGYATAAQRATLAQQMAYSFNQTDLNKAVADEVKSQLSRNLDLNISLDSSPSFAAFLRQRDLDHSFTFFRGVAVPDYADPHAVLSVNFTSGAAANGGLYSDPDFDRAIGLADADPNPAVRNQNYSRAAVLLNKNAVAFPLYADLNARIQKPRVLNWGWTLAGLLPFKYAGLQ